MDKIKIMVIDGVVEDVFSTNPNVEVEVVNTTWTHYSEMTKDTLKTMKNVY